MTTADRSVTGSHDAVAASAHPSVVDLSRPRKQLATARPRRSAWSHRSVASPAGPDKYPSIERRGPQCAAGKRRETKTRDKDDRLNCRSSSEQLATITKIGNGQPRRLCPPEACPPVVKLPGTLPSCHIIVCIRATLHRLLARTLTINIRLSRHFMRRFRL